MKRVNVLYRRDSFVFQCHNDRTVVAIKADDLHPDSIRLQGSVWKKRPLKLVRPEGLAGIFWKPGYWDACDYVACPTCEAIFDFREVIQEPKINLRLESGKCRSCGAAFAKGDERCGSCGNPL